MAWTASKGWDAARVEIELEKFHAWHQREGTLSASDPGCWTTWVLNGVRFDGERATKARPRNPNAGGTGQVVL